jgi:hypothetical protein
MRPFVISHEQAVAKVYHSEDKRKTNLDMMGAVIWTFCFNDLVRSYLPLMGLAAARIEVLAFSVAFTPALVMEIVCCSMAS